MGRRDVNVKKSLGGIYDRIKESRVLLVGAGGIGCELLKNLVLTGYGEIHIVDLDTIDLSNLNRQFLFNMQHIKKPKAMVAKETAGRFNPNVKLHAHHANIKDPSFNVQWFGGFDIVFNALDNLDARRHVNKMCLSADVPLVESGTTGFDGQVQVIRKGASECYDCTQKPVPKTFPVCTIRSTPSQPIHCIVWAKSYLFQEIFGTSEDESPELNHEASSAGNEAQEIETLRREAQELQQIRSTIGSDEFARSVFEKVFKRDIERLRGMEDMWKTRKTPVPLDYDQLVDSVKHVNAKIFHNDQKVWSLEESYAVFYDSLQRLSKRMMEAQQNNPEDRAPVVLSFDKDDVDTLDFVAASANLRSYIFGIDLRSKFDIKQMAGNIIPAIATTNAIVAGVCVLQAFKILQNEIQNTKMVFLSRSAERAFNTDRLNPPNPSCEVCGVARNTLEADLARATLGDLIDIYLKKSLGYGEELSILSEQLLYDFDFDDNLDTSLADLGIKDGSFITVIDEDEEDTPRVNLVLVVVNKALPENSEPVISPVGFDIPRKPRKTSTSGSSGTSNGTLALQTVSDGQPTPKKRKIGDISDLTIREQQSGSPHKKGKVAAENVDYILIEDSGPIEIE